MTSSLLARMRVITIPVDADKFTCDDATDDDDANECDMMMMMMMMTMLVLMATTLMPLTCAYDTDDRYEGPLLRPLLEDRLRDSTQKFDTMHLVDFRLDRQDSRTERGWCRVQGDGGTTVGYGRACAFHLILKA